MPAPRTAWFELFQPKSASAAALDESVARQSRACNPRGVSAHSTAAEAHHSFRRRHSPLHHTRRRLPCGTASRPATMYFQDGAKARHPRQGTCACCRPHSAQRSRKMEKEATPSTVAHRSHPRHGRRRRRTHHHRGRRRRSRGHRRRRRRSPRAGCLHRALAGSHAPGTACTDSQADCPRARSCGENQGSLQSKRLCPRVAGRCHACAHRSSGVLLCYSVVPTSQCADTSKCAVSWTQARWGLLSPCGGAPPGPVTCTALVRPSSPDST